MIQVTGLTKLYGTRDAVTDLTFHAEKGEILGFLGPNGAGKTTTMRILSGYMPPTSGTAKVAGFDILKESFEVRSRVGYMPETVPLYTDMTVFDFLKYMADLRRVPEAEDRVDVVLDMVNLGDRSESLIESLSKGMRQRVGLAQALLHEPDVLILDEPTIGLDPAQIIAVRELIREVGKERTVLLSTHILSEVQQMCSRVIIINNGRIVAEDTPENLEKRLEGVQRVSIKLRKNAEGLVDVLGNVPGIDTVKLIAQDEVEFQTEPGVDNRPEVAKVVVEAGFELLELKSAGMSLEEIFLKVTREDGTETESAPENGGGALEGDIPAPEASGEETNIEEEVL